MDLQRVLRTLNYSLFTPGYAEEIVKTLGVSGGAIGITSDISTFGTTATTADLQSNHLYYWAIPTSGNHVGRLPNTANSGDTIRFLCANVGDTQSGRFRVNLNGIPYAGIQLGELPLRSGDIRTYVITYIDEIIGWVDTTPIP